MKKHLEISSLYTCVPKIMIRWSEVPEIWYAKDRQTDGHTDGQKKWHIEVGVPPKNHKKPLTLFNFFLSVQQIYLLNKQWDTVESSKRFYEKWKRVLLKKLNI